MSPPFFEYVPNDITGICKKYGELFKRLFVIGIS
jgi:hypothetical protein